MLDFFSPTVLGIAGLILVAVICLVVVVRRYRIAEADEVIIVVGRKNKVLRDSEGNVVSDKSGVKVVRGGVFVLPFIQKSSTLKLSSRKLKFQSGSAVSLTGVIVDVEAVATIKVGDDEDSIRAAAQRFLHQQNEIEPFAQEQLQGELRAIVGAKSVEDIISNREGIAQAVKEAAEASLSKQGLVLDNFIIQSIKDEGEYIANLGRPKQAEILRTAEIAEARAQREAQEARIEAERAVADATRELALRQAAIKQEVDKVNAEAAAATPLAEAIQQQTIIEQQKQTAVKQAELRERQLDTEVRKPADAENYRQRQIAEAAAYSTRQEAEAERDRRLADAQAVRAEGEAEGAAILAKGNAEAETIEARAKALREQGTAILQQDIIKLLPEIAREISAPMGNIDHLTVVGTDGASAMGKTVANGMTELPALVKATTGIDLSNLLNGAVQGAAMGATAAKTTHVLDEKMKDADRPFDGRRAADRAAKRATQAAAFPEPVTSSGPVAPPVIPTAPSVGTTAVTEDALTPAIADVRPQLRALAAKIKKGIGPAEMQELVQEVMLLDPDLASEAISLWQQGATLGQLRALLETAANAN